jgi:transposase
VWLSIFNFVARAAFPAGSLCIRISDELGTIFQDQDFADLYSQHGQPGQPPFRLALVTVLQFIEGLSDRGAADTVRGRIDWKYLLCLELDDPGFDHSVLCEFRARLLEGGAERILFDKILSALRGKKLVKPRTRQRTDSTHVLTAVRDLNRLERVGDTRSAARRIFRDGLVRRVDFQVDADRRYAWRSAFVGLTSLASLSALSAQITYQPMSISHHLRPKRAAFTSL